MAKKYRCSSTVISSKRTSCWGHRPRSDLTPSMSTQMSWPLTTAVPDVGGKSPVSMEIVVVLPAPLWPSRAVIWPSYMEMDRSFTASFFPNVCGSKVIERLLKHDQMKSLEKWSSEKGKLNFFWFSHLNFLAKEQKHIKVSIPPFLSYSYSLLASSRTMRWHEHLSSQSIWLLVPVSYFIIHLYHTSNY